MGGLATTEAAPGIAPKIDFFAPDFLAASQTGPAESALATPGVEAAQSPADRLKPVAAGCGPIACDSCPFAKLCRGEVDSSLSAPAESDAAGSSPTPEAPATTEKAATPVEAPAETPAPAVTAAKPSTPAVSETKQDTVKPIAAAPSKTEQTTPLTPATRAAEQQARESAATVDAVQAQETKVQTAHVEVTPPANEHPTTVTSANARETARQTAGASHVPESESAPAIREESIAEVAAAEATARQLLTEQNSPKIDGTTALANTAPEDTATGHAADLKAAAAHQASLTEPQEVSSHSTSAPAPEAQVSAVEGTEAAITPERTDAPPTPKSTVRRRQAQVAAAQPAPERTITSTVSSIAEVLTVKLAAKPEKIQSEAAAKVTELLEGILWHEDGRSPSATETQPEQERVANAIEALSELLEIDATALTKAIQASAGEGVIRPVHLAKILTAIQEQLNSGAVSKYETDRLNYQSYLNAAFDPFAATLSTQQTNRYHNICLALATVLRRYSDHENQDSLATA